MDWKPTKTQIEVAARADGYGEYDVIEYVGGRWYGSVFGRVGRTKLPDYANDLNAVQRLIDRLEFKENENCEYERYVNTLRGIVGGFFYIPRATASQEFQAVCLVKGWE